MKLEVLNDYGFKYEEGLYRCMNDTEFYSMILKMFLEDCSLANALEAYKHKDFERVFDYLHELKGTCGNMGIRKLFDAVSPVVELVRNKATDVDLAADLKEIEDIYNAAKVGIRKALNE